MKLTEVLDKELFKEESTLIRSPVDSILGSFIVDQLPVAISETEWDTLDAPERLVRKFVFESSQGLRKFIEVILDYQDYKNHHGKIIIENKDVTVEAYTHDYDGVTSLDKELAKFCDEIYEEISYYEEEIEGERS